VSASQKMLLKNAPTRITKRRLFDLSDHLSEPVSQTNTLDAQTGLLISTNKVLPCTAICITLQPTKQTNKLHKLLQLTIAFVKTKVTDSTEKAVDESN
jgi:hypothetical protein